MPIRKRNFSLCAQMQELLMVEQKPERPKLTVNRFQPKFNRFYSVDLSPPSTPPSSPALSSASSSDYMELHIDMNAFDADVQSVPLGAENLAKQSGKRKRDNDDELKSQTAKRIKPRNFGVKYSTQPIKSDNDVKFGSVYRATSQLIVHEGLDDIIKRTIVQIFGSLCPTISPDPNTVHQLLINKPPSVVVAIFQKFVIYCEQMLDKYFCAFLYYFVQHKLRNEIIDMAKFCQRPYGKVENLNFVVDALRRTGIDYSIAVLRAFEMVKERSKIAALAFYEIITSPRNDNINIFEKQLRAIHELLKFEYKPVAIDRIMRVCIENKFVTSSIVSMAFTIYNNAPTDVFQQLDQVLTTQFVSFYFARHDQQKLKADVSKQPKKMKE